VEENSTVFVTAPPVSQISTTARSPGSTTGRSDGVLDVEIPKRGGQGIAGESPAGIP